jgi:hypothetical protein
MIIIFEIEKKKQFLLVDFFIYFLKLRSQDKRDA